MQLLPIGTIIEINGIELMIMGYRDYQTEKFNFFYIVSVFPIGFTGDENSLSLIPIDQDYKVIATGYLDIESKQYLENKESCYATLRNSDPKEIEKLIDMIVEEE